MSLFEASIVSFYDWDKTDRMIFGVFGEAIDKFDVRVVTGLECQKIQHKRASCVKTGLECQNLTRLLRAWVGGATGVALERDINQHMDAEGEIAREQVRGET